MKLDKDYLQMFFLAPDKGPEGGSEREEEEDSEEGFEPVNQEDDEVEFVVEDELEEEDIEDSEEETEAEEASDKEAQLSQQVAELRAMVAESQAQGQKQETQDLLKELTAAIKGDRGEAQQQQASNYLEEFKKKHGEDWVDQPIDTMAELVTGILQKELVPYLQQMNSQIQETRTMTGREAARKDTFNQMVMDNFSDEVDEEVKKVQPGPNAYSEAASRVGQRHFSEIVQMQVQKALQEAQETEESPEKKVKSKGKRAKGASPSRSAGGNPPQKNKVPLTSSELDYIKRHALVQGVTEQAARRYLYDRGLIGPKARNRKGGK